MDGSGLTSGTHRLMRGVPSSLPRAAAILAVLQLCAIVTLAAVTVARSPIFGLDEGAHLAYVAQIADHGRLPWLGRDPSPWQVQAIDEGAYPHHSTVPARRAGLAGENYEAFQPPLYYVLATPAYLVGASFISKVRAVRIFDVILLLAAVAILALLARDVFGKRWLIPYCMVLTVVMWPGVLIRVVTASNQALELPIGLLYVLACWRATTYRDGRWMISAGVLLGLCLLSSPTLACLAPLLLLPIGAFLRARRTGKVMILAAVTAALPVLMVAPWLASNESRYGALTGERIVKREQMSTINPTGHHYSGGDVVSAAWQTSRAVLPQEWWQEYSRPHRASILRAPPILLVLLAVGALAALIWRRHSPVSRETFMLGGPYVLGMIMLGAGVLIEQWPVLLARYLNPELTLLGLVAMPAATTRRGRTAALAGVTALTLVVAGIWAYMIGAYLVPSLGAHLGIRAASVSSVQQHLRRA